jgi:hypothetical protein
VVLISNDTPAVLHSFQISVDTRLPHIVTSNPPEVGPFIGVTALNSKHTLNGTQKSRDTMQSCENALIDCENSSRILKNLNYYSRVMHLTFEGVSKLESRTTII